MVMSVSRPSSLVFLLSFAWMPVMLGAPAASKNASSSNALPQAFAGWERTGVPSTSTDPAVADDKNAPVLKEYGFSQVASASYTNGDNKLALRELTFQDATGAYGAFTFYRVPGTSPEEIGVEAAANGTHIVYWTGDTLVDAVFDHLTAMSAAALRDLADTLPKPVGAKSNPPSLPGYLPKENREITYTRYAIGPEGYTRSGGLLPPELIDFNRGAEVLTGTFNEHNGTGQLTIIEYPTPQIAADRERAIEAFLKAGPPRPGSPQKPWPLILTESNTQALMAKRTGPLVAMTSGALDDKDAQTLLGRVHYEASVTWNKPQAVSEPNRAARLLVGVITLFFILGGIAILLGIFFGGGRVMIRKLQGKPASSVHEAEFIKLDLK